MYSMRHVYLYTPPYPTISTFRIVPVVSPYTRGLPYMAPLINLVFLRRQY